MPLLRSRRFLLVLAVAALALGQGGRPLENARVRQLGEQLTCLCGCGSSVTSCNMLQCHFSEPAREQLLSMVNAGLPDEAIFAAFVKQYGKQILMKPPAEGFDLLGYLMPFGGILLGLAFVWWMIKRFRKPLAVAGGPPMDDGMLDRYRERIEKDLEKLD